MIDYEAHTDFWWFVNERHRIYIKKETGKEKPWTNDPILRDWKFCNVFRRLDKQSQWLIKNVIEPAPDDDAAGLLFNIFAFRAFNWYPTYKLIRRDNWNPEIAKDQLYAHVSEGGQLTSGAYMIRGREGIGKYESIVMTLDKIWQERVELIDEIFCMPFMQSAWGLILDHEFWGWGPFTAYQVVLDLTYTPILDFASDINDWTIFGPGAKRGLKEIWPNIESKHYLEAAKDLWKDQVKYREPHVPELTLQDIEFCLCELQKYRRIKRGGKSKERYDGR